MKEKVVLAYSGGLDTSVILKWLMEKGYEVIAFVADVGQEDDFEECRKKALLLGASKVIIKDLRKEFVENYVFKAIMGNAVYEDRYLLGTALARPLIAKTQIEVAVSEAAGAVAHGATGKGNDQVRFELSYYALKPDIKVISPWKDKEFLEKFKGRTDLLKYASEMKIPVKASIDKPYSEDDNIMHISHEAGILEDPMFSAQKDMLLKMVLPQDAPDKETRLVIHFRNGIPVKVINKDDGTLKDDSLDMFIYLNEIAGRNGIGLLDMVENRYVGIKSRGVYETPAATVLHVAHRDLEGIAMDREVMRLRNMLAPKFAELIYYGFWFSPEMDFLMAAIEKSQEIIDGSVHLCLYKGNILIEGRESPSSLYDKELSSMDIEGGFDQTDSRGFIRINAIRLMAHRAIVEASKKKN
ncbi:MAG TPA: argininosuccinate synthase [Bacteroidales bacterium]|nr:argininosuccinate synthase [Bacteroidales bacterium]HNR41235.1 argininosuccinate synthase [Bacteroidales bacterium]HQG77026.1 argininosuccinate synthase [Bacteroidales bacterium]